MSKGYTISYFIDVLKNTTARQVANKGVYETVSPRFGGFSVKADALDTWLNFNTTAIARGDGQYANFGKTARARL
jgi:hypothetical protein